VEAACGVREALPEGRVVVDLRLAHQETRRAALLAGVTEGRAHGVQDRQVAIRQGTDDDCVLAPRLGDELATAPGAQESARRLRRARQHDRRHARVCDEPAADGIVCGRQELDHRPRDPRVPEEACQHPRCQDRLRGRLEDHGVARHVALRREGVEGTAIVLGEVHGLGHLGVGLAYALAPIGHRCTDELAPRLPEPLGDVREDARAIRDAATTPVAGGALRRGDGAIRQSGVRQGGAIQPASGQRRIDAVHPAAPSPLDLRAVHLTRHIDPPAGLPASRGGERPAAIVGEREVGVGLVLEGCVEAGAGRGCASVLGTTGS
jgi:hypothetical protein